MLKTAIEESDEAIDESDIEDVIPEESGTSLLKRRLASIEAADKIKGVRQSRTNRRRKRKRNESILSYGHRPCVEARRKISTALAPVHTSMSAQDLPSASCGYIAVPFRPDTQIPEKEELGILLDQGYSYIEWDGGHPKPMLDRNGVIFACLVGKPNDPAYDRSCIAVYKKLETMGQECRERNLLSGQGNRRGEYSALNVGITHGKGTKRPVNLHAEKDGKTNHITPIIEELLADSDVCKLATFASYSLSFWAPKLYQYYKTELDQLWEREPSLLQNFVKSVFPCATFNFGPNVWTRRHRDSMNCPFGWCAIQALGEFDHTKGGHLVLPDLKMVVEFPSGTTILIPSATLTHSNIPVGDGEKRASFTQFCPGGLLRYVDAHFMTEKSLKAFDRAEYERLQKEKPNRWMRGIRLLSSLPDIVD